MDPLENVVDFDNPGLDSPDSQVDDVREEAVRDSPLRFIGTDTQGSHVSHVYATPNGSKFYVPEVKPDVLPVVGFVFRSIDEVQHMYERYASKAGFAARVGPSKVYKGVLTHRVYRCHRAGKPRRSAYDSVFPDLATRARSTSFTSTDCKALLRAKLINGSKSYMVYCVDEKHNHELVPSHNMDLLRVGWQLNFDDVMFVHSLSLNRIGPNVAHRLATSLRRRHHSMHGNRNAYKNVSRDIRMFIGDRDVQLFLKKLEDRAANLPNFAFDVKHDGREFCSVFWADNVSQLNYRSFGDVVTFDATYSTNKYNMIFVPFTGVDHHKKCVTFGAGLLKSESVESYQWFLRCFLKVHQVEPRLLLTDQDPAMCIAVPSVFKKANHRLCMWHIMKKLSMKVPAEAMANTELRSSLLKLVWNNFITPSTFEHRWETLVKKYKLTTNIWLRDMYAIRHLWVPAYFREMPLCCLMRTTSRSESSNALFKVNSTPANTLVQFLMCYDTSIDNQRYNQRIEEFRTNSSKPVLRTELEIELDASKAYTHSIFIEVQKEIMKGFNVCFITNVELLEHSKEFTVSQKDKADGSFLDFTVSYHLHEGSYDCSCRGFTRLGYLCRHIFCVFRYNNVTQIPYRYVLLRWRRKTLPSVVYTVESRLSADNTLFTTVRNEIMDVVSEVVDQFMDDVDSMNLFKEELTVIKDRLVANSAGSSSAASSRQKRKALILKGVVGDVPEDAECLLPPQGIRNKGCGTSSRLAGPGEKAIAASKKPKRLCRTCKQIGHHDSRNCPLNADGNGDDDAGSSSDGSLSHWR